MPRELFRLDQLTLSQADARSRIADNYQSVLRDVADAMSAAGRSADEVRVVGVSKYVDETITSWLIDAGCRDLGENRPQVLLQKHAALDATLNGLAASTDRSGNGPEPVRWHQIGHLQRNKVRKLITARPMIHSVDSPRLLREIADQAADIESPLQVLIELNVSGEAAKTGLPPGELQPLLQAHLDGPSGGVEIVGLMAMAGWGTDHDAARRQFALLREHRDAAATATGLALPELSMGMSGDYAQAIAEGATLVRIGSRLFDGVIAD